MFVYENLMSQEKNNVNLLADARRMMLCNDDGITECCRQFHLLEIVPMIFNLKMPAILLIKDTVDDATLDGYLWVMRWNTLFIYQYLLLLFRWAPLY